MKRHKKTSEKTIANETDASEMQTFFNEKCECLNMQKTVCVQMHSQALTSTAPFMHWF